ncbi:MAG: substrate-binding domain-containing protein [Lapillicoccus sp.]
MHSFRMTLMAVVAGLATVVAVGTAPALALPTSNKTADTLTFVGSDTTQYFDDAFCTAVNNNTKGDNPKPLAGAKDTCVNVHAFAAPGETVKVAPADAFSAACTWSIPPNAAPAGSSCVAGGNGKETAPSGSGAGAARQEANPTDASVDVGRASSLQCNSTRPNLECYAYARDAVGYATYRATAITLTTAQIQGIYNCSITNWSQVPGAGTGVITRFFPQNGSGTGSFFVTNFLNGVDPRLSTTCTATQVPENDGSAIPAASRANAIVPFSAGAWIAQGNGVVPDTRNGIKIGKVKVGGKTFAPVAGTSGAYKPNAAAFNEGSAYPGARYVFHNVDNRAPQYGPALRFIGFDATGKSKLCSGAFATTLKQYGFQALSNLAGDAPDAGTCRKILS